MAEIIKLVYNIIIFLLLFIDVTDVEGGFNHLFKKTRIKCFSDSDCVKLSCQRPFIPKCINKYCKCVLTSFQW
ncbi:unnamed protein product [Trifolium pratense]|uniref:Uncharacterized protein n=1 Tax=Trifolium pratense TaxID=57577 RepID=A0ACB0LJH6_TRIPR|nr:unnamed protein product [Trifolium pratense]